METYELIIVGAGPAGLTAAIYAKRYKINVLVIGEHLGGWASEAYEIENFPTYKIIKGFEFTQKMKEQLDFLGIGVKNGIVKSIEKNGNGFLVKTSSEEYLAKKIILAKGSEKRKLGIEKEDKLLGKGLSYCATCDGAFFKDKVVGVVGGGNSALTSALLLSKFAEKVYLIHRGEDFSKADPFWVEEVKKIEKIEIILNSNISELKGEDKLEGIILDNGKEIKLKGLFIEIGFIPSTSLVEELGVELDKGQIRVDKEQRTNVPGLFAAGDITDCPLKQIVVACGQGAVAAYSAYKELITFK